MKKITLGTIILVILIGGYVLYQPDRITTTAAFYQGLAQECKKKTSESCCLASVKRMEETGSFPLEAYPNGICDDGYEREMMKCIDSFTWCEKMTNGAK